MKFSFILSATIIAGFSVVAVSPKTREKATKTSTATGTVVTTKIVSSPNENVSTIIQYSNGSYYGIISEGPETVIRLTEESANKYKNLTSDHIGSENGLSSSNSRGRSSSRSNSSSSSSSSSNSSKRRSIGNRNSINSSSDIYSYSGSDKNVIKISSSISIPSTSNISKRTNWTNKWTSQTVISGSSNANTNLISARPKREIIVNNYVMGEQCDPFVNGDKDSPKNFYSPGYPNNYPNNTACFRVLEAPPGHMIRLDFRNYFDIEPSDGCAFDFLEIRDGPYGFSSLKGRYCGQTFPPMIYSKERHLWLYFHSDENIEYSGFAAVWEAIERPTTSIPEDLDCRIYVSGLEGFVNRSDVPADIEETVTQHKIPLDCMWIITVNEGWKMHLSFTAYKLDKPNECDKNFIDIFGEKPDIESRLKHYCGSIADPVMSLSNVLHIRFFARYAALASTFSILYTAYREKSSATCADDEYDCEDTTCISLNLKCNGRINCRFQWDEDECESAEKKQQENIEIIIVIFCLILGGMLVTFLVNCTRRLIRDQKIIREHIRQSKESKLDELGRVSAKRSRENLSKLSTKGKQSECSLQILDNISNRYYREMMPISVPDNRINSKNDGSTMIGKNHNIPAESSFCEDMQAGGDREGMCDMGCQTRESLFQPLVRQKSISSSSPNQSAAIRFSTFGYDTSPISRHDDPGGDLSNKDKCRTQATTIEMDDFSCMTGPPKAYEACPQHHQPTQSHHKFAQGRSRPGGPQPQLQDGGEKSKPKMDESKVFIDIRNSAPDVIIMTSH